jgi:hypothetical protein
MGETNSPSVPYMGYDISDHSRELNLKFQPLAWRLVVKFFNLTLLSGEIS